MDFERVINTVGDFLQREHRRHAVAGAIALHAYGISRATLDLDLVDTNLGRVDVIYVSGETSRQLFDEARGSVSLGDRRFAVPKPEHLIAMKLQAVKNDPRRELRDLADVQALLRLPGIDQDEVRCYFERAGLLERYHQLRRHA